MLNNTEELYIKSAATNEDPTIKQLFKIIVKLKQQNRNLHKALKEIGKDDK